MDTHFLTHGRVSKWGVPPPPVSYGGHTELIWECLVCVCRVCVCVLQLATLTPIIARVAS